jgi:hypothetical protein
MLTTAVQLKYSACIAIQWQVGGVTTEKKTAFTDTYWAAAVCCKSLLAMGLNMGDVV